MIRFLREEQFERRYGLRCGEAKIHTEDPYQGAGTRADLPGGAVLAGPEWGAVAPVARRLRCLEQRRQALRALG